MDIDEGFCVVMIDRNGRPRVTSDLATMELAEDYGRRVPPENGRVIGVMSHTAFAKMFNQEPSPKN